MLARSWISIALPVALPLVLGACGGDKDGGDTSPGTEDTSPTGTTTTPPSPLEAFVANDWYGTATRGTIEFPCEADLAYDAEADQVVGTMDIDALWDVVIVENEDGSFSGSGTPVFGDDTLDLSDLAVDGNGDMAGSWTWDYGNGVYEGTFLMSPGGPG